MDVVLLNEKITFQKNSVEVDAIGNHKNDGVIIMLSMQQSVVRVVWKSKL